MLAVRDHVDGALVDYGDPAEGAGDLHDELGVGVVGGSGPGPLEDGLDEAGELHGVGREHGLGVAPDEGGRVDEVPEAVGVDHQRDVGGFHLERKREGVRFRSLQIFFESFEVKTSKK